MTESPTSPLPAGSPIFELLFGVLFVWTRYNLWLPIIVHGVVDTVGLTFIYLDVDRALNRLLF